MPAVTARGCARCFRPWRIRCRVRRRVPDHRLPSNHPVTSHRLTDRAMETPISFDSSNGRFSGGSLIERAGLSLLKFGARLTGPYQFLGYSYGAKLVRSVLPSRSTVCVEVEPDQNPVHPDRILKNPHRNLLPQLLQAGFYSCSTKNGSQLFITLLKKLSTRLCLHN